MSKNVGPHLEAFEYDGAFQCLKCKKHWGALPGKPEMPLTCEKNPYQERFEYLEKEIRRLEKEKNMLEEVMRYA